MWEPILLRLAHTAYSTWGGDVFQMIETSIGGTTRLLKGGGWNGNFAQTQSNFQSGVDSANEDASTGFRVASVPEPSTFVLGGIGALGFLAIVRRRIQENRERATRGR